MLREEPYGRLSCSNEGPDQGSRGGTQLPYVVHLAMVPKTRGPPACEGEKPRSWGLPGLCKQGQGNTDNDSILLVRFLVIMVLAHERVKRHGVQCSSSPSASKCSSIWVTEWLRTMIQALGLTLIHFDQCRMGQHTPNPTTLATNLPLFHWQNLRCNHDPHRRAEGMSSSDLSRYPFKMMQGLAKALLEADFAQGQSRMDLQDNPVRVQLGFRTRPLRDGGGKPSWGRSPPHMSPPSPCPSLAKDLAALCEPWVQDFTTSIHQGNKSHPFSVHLLSQIRERISKECHDRKGNTP